MELITESNVLADYLEETHEIDFTNHDILLLRDQLKARSENQIDYIKNAFEFVRDQISHSWDIQSRRITVAASEVLKHGEGICYAKSNLLAALLRSANVPTGFCYQRLTLGDTPDTGYCIHALNGVYLSEIKKWIRLDARGNKEGIQAQFSIETEALAFPIRDELDEIDYPKIYNRPHPKTLHALNSNSDCRVMYLNKLPTYI